MDAIAESSVEGNPVADRSIEFVERKGIGHPDSLCDGVAEAVSQHYRSEFGRIHYHNTDKVHLDVGTVDPEFGGGTGCDPICGLVGERATRSTIPRRSTSPRRRTRASSPTQSSASLRTWTA